LVCGEAAGGYDVIKQTRQLLPDLVILDFLMPRMDGLRAAREMRRIIPGLPVLLFTMHLSKQLVEEARSAGIRGALSKNCFGQVPEAIETLLRKETFYSLEPMPYAA
jgi:DNA-binding NarL/FixJ family response regulator